MTNPFDPNAAPTFAFEGAPNSIVVIGGARAASGTEYVIIRQNDRLGHIRRELFSPDPGKALDELKRYGILSFTSPQRSQLASDVINLVDFPATRLVESVGWSRDTGDFGYPDGRTITPDGIHVPVTYPGGVVSVASSGSLRSWKRRVVRPLIGQHIPTFAILIALSAPLLALVRIQGNVGFLFHGQARKGKTTCLDVAASVCGQPLDGPARYYRKFTSTTFHLAELMLHYNDLPFLIDELGSLDAVTARTGIFKSVAHLFSGVDQRGRFGDQLGPTRQMRSPFLITSNYSPQEMLKFETEDVAEAVIDRLPGIPFPRGDEGAFNAGHVGFASYRDLAEHVRRQAGRHHGTAMPAFLARLVVDRQSRGPGLIDYLHQQMDEFSATAAREVRQPVSSRILDSFGLCYAAGQLAKSYGILPEQVDCMAAAMHCLRLHIGERVEADPLQRLLSWLSGAELIDLRGRRRLPALSDEALGNRGVFIGECNGQAQIWVLPSLFRQTFTNPRDMLSALIERRVLKKDHGRRTIQCAVRADKRLDRMNVFFGPDISAWLEQNGIGEGDVRKTRR